MRKELTPELTLLHAFRRTLKMLLSALNEYLGIEEEV